MAFGQSPGPPAGQRQLNRLLELVNAAGHRDFRDARGPLDLTQRQANGKFTRGEADALIELLEGQAEAAAGWGEPRTQAPGSGHSDGAGQRRISQDERRATEAQRSLAGVTDEVLAAELQRRGWIVVAP